MTVAIYSKSTRMRSPNFNFCRASCGGVQRSLAGLPGVLRPAANANVGGHLGWVVCGADADQSQAGLQRCTPAVAWTPFVVSVVATKRAPYF